MLKFKEKPNISFLKLFQSQVNSDKVQFVGGLCTCKLHNLLFFCPPAKTLKIKIYRMIVLLPNIMAELLTLMPHIWEVSAQRPAIVTEVFVVFLNPVKSHDSIFPVHYLLIML
jgi:hypothetical protein